MLLLVNVHEAKTNLSKLLAQVEEGKEVIIARAGNRRPAGADRKTDSTAHSRKRKRKLIADDLMHRFLKISLRI